MTLKELKARFQAYGGHVEAVQNLLFDLRGVSLKSLPKEVRLLVGKISYGENLLYKMLSHPDGKCHCHPSGRRRR